ncbi:hypothetical protein [Streptomyces sp. NPDC058861]|uniref:hypothetical protein n=1 Tax=Streptomyces sp. NPDC058861 TaxID=3346653 RepID=UPI0036ABFB83
MNVRRTAHALSQTINTYISRYPDEKPGLSPVWEALQQHVRAGACLHWGTCPAPQISPIVLDEEYRVLMLQGHTRARFPEVGATDDFETFTEAAATLARALGIGNLWVQPGFEIPLHLAFTRADARGGLRPQMVIRYLYRTHSSSAKFVEAAPQMWVPLDEADSGLAERVRSFTAEAIG